MWYILHFNHWYVNFSAVPIGIIVVQNDVDLEQVRQNINQLHEVWLSVLHTNS